MTRVVVIGVGNPFRRDDGVGHVVVGELRPLVPTGVELVELDGEPARLVEAWDGADLAVVVDAVSTGSAPGAVHRWHVGVDALPDPTGAVAGSHALGPAEAVALGGVLDRLPHTLVVFGVEVGDVGEGPGLSDAVAGAVDDAVDEVLVELGLQASIGHLARVAERESRRGRPEMTHVEPSPGDGAGGEPGV